MDKQTILAAERLRRRWSQTKLGYFSGGCEQSHISKYEHRCKAVGRMRGDRIALAMGLPYDALFDEHGLARLEPSDAQT